MAKQCECGCGGIAKNRFIFNHHGRIAIPWHRGLHGEDAPGFKHGMYGTPEYAAYLSARDRCKKPTHPAYKHYGGRGIQFLFTSFEHWFAVLGLRPAGKDKNGRALYSIDRINNDGNYEPGNVRWATATVQANNRRCSRKAA